MAVRLLDTVPVAALLVVLTACQDAARPLPSEPTPRGSLNSSPAPDEGATRCEGTFVGASFDNVYVPMGASCNLYRAVVRGRVVALPGSTLFTSESEVGGDVIGVRTYRLQVLRSSVGGDVRIQGGVDPSGIAGVQSTHLPAGSVSIEGVSGQSVYVSFMRLDNGSVTVEGNTAFLLFVEDNKVGGNITVSRNQGPGIKYAYRNTVRGTLSCFDNHAPFVGGPNTAGRIEGQCY